MMATSPTHHHQQRHLTMEPALQDASAGNLATARVGGRYLPWRTASSIRRCPPALIPHRGGASSEALQSDFLVKLVFPSIPVMESVGGEHLPMKDGFLHWTVPRPRPRSALPRHHEAASSDTLQGQFPCMTSLLASHSAPHKILAVLLWHN